MAIGVLAVGCSHASAPPSAAPAAADAPRIQLAVLPAESDAFPRAARALSASLTSAKIAGVDDTTISKVSLEVVQLSIECVDPTAACYEAIGRSLAANRLLFARIDGRAAATARRGERGKKRALKVSVTLFDVDARATTRTAEKLFATEDDATAGAAALVAEVTR